MPNSTTLMEAPRLQQAIDFADEARDLHALLAGMDDNQRSEPTGFKAWTTEDIVRHLHLWNQAADFSAVQPDALTLLKARIDAAGSMRVVERESVPETGDALVTAWIELVLDMEARWVDLDPKRRLPWVGPDMSARSSMTARQMEHWAHGQAIYDLLGKERQDAARLKNIVVLGVNTFGWTFAVREQQAPGAMPHLSLTAPDGDIWSYGGSDTDRISGSAKEFCQVVTQTRNIADTALYVEGSVAEAWMQNAQCFAGGPETPPAAGTRRRRTV
ncbi:MAG: TIGR03084 family metal-binding protein [Pseudomonadota bacterium]